MDAGRLGCQHLLMNSVLPFLKPVATCANKVVEELSPNMHGIILSVFLATRPPYVLPKISGLSPKILYLYRDERRDTR